MRESWGPNEGTLCGVDPAAFRPISAVVFAFNEEAGLRRCIPALLASPVDEILVMAGGDDGSRDYLAELRDPRIRVEFETQRLGKWRAFNRALELIRGDRVFLISGDVWFDPSLIDRLLARFAPDVGVIFPRVTPSNIRTSASRLGETLWDLHDRGIVACAQAGMPIHGGELQLVRRSLLEPMVDVINEDAYLCLRAIGRGYRVLYDRTSVVHNTVPETFSDLMIQRARVNYGHDQLSEAGLDPSTLDRLVWVRPGMCARVFAASLDRRPDRMVWLPILAVLELAALARGRGDRTRGIEYGRWAKVRSGKGVGLGRPEPERTRP